MFFIYKQVNYAGFVTYTNLPSILWRFQKKNTVRILWKLSRLRPQSKLYYLLGRNIGGNVHNYNIQVEQEKVRYVKVDIWLYKGNYQSCQY